MLVQESNNWKGNRASRRANPEVWTKREAVKQEVNARGWSLQAQISNEIDPKINRDDLEARLNDLGITQDPERPARQANRRKTDARGGKGASAFAYFHPEMGKPEVGVRMVSLYRKNEGLEVELEGGEQNPENVKAESGVAA